MSLDSLVVCFLYYLYIKVKTPDENKNLWRPYVLKAVATLRNTPSTVLVRD